MVKYNHLPTQHAPVREDPRTVTVVPPNEHIRQCGLHWLAMIDHDRRYTGLIALEWAPAAQCWYHSNGTASCSPTIYTGGWAYVAPIAHPGIDTVAKAIEGK
jgi:hypothetical protein